MPVFLRPIRTWTRVAVIRDSRQLSAHAFAPQVNGATGTELRSCRQLVRSLGTYYFRVRLGCDFSLLDGAAIAAFVTDLVRLILQRGAVQLYALPSAPISLVLFLASISAAFLLAYFLTSCFQA